MTALMVLGSAYVTVLAAEVAGDKTLYTVGALSARFDRSSIWLGAVPAFMAKMGIAVIVGDSLQALPRPLLLFVSASTFFGMAVALWYRRDAAPASPEAPHRIRAAGVSFVALFFSEWCDPGQLAAAAVAMRYRAPLVVWLAAVTAMATKGALAMAIGGRLRVRLRSHTLRLGTLAVCLVLGLLALVGVG